MIMYNGPHTKWLYDIGLKETAYIIYACYFGSKYQHLCKELKTNELFRVEC